MDINKEIEKMKKDPEYIFAVWARENGWVYDIKKKRYVKNNDELTLPQLREVFNDFKTLKDG